MIGYMIGLAVVIPIISFIVGIPFFYILDRIKNGSVINDE
jgi:hypothetical protein